jgi:hypothetical protein
MVITYHPAAGLVVELAALPHRQTQIQALAFGRIDGRGGGRRGNDVVYVHAELLVLQDSTVGPNVGLSEDKTNILRFPPDFGGGHFP